ncbi:MAG: C4-type zinc ribbon domain-containing protein [bacterium]
MKEIIGLLFSLQQLDDEIDELRTEQDAIPEGRVDLDRQVAEIADRIKSHKQGLLDLAKQRKEMEAGLEEAGQKRVKFQAQSAQVKSNREYDALQHEIGALDEQISKREDEILEILERSESVSKTIAEEEQALKAATGSVKQEHAVLDETATRLDRAIQAKSAERDRLIAGLEAPLVARYERIRDVKDGLAVATVKNGACSGCFRRIPPQEMQILRRSDRIMSCEGCGRIIIWREEA